MAKNQWWRDPQYVGMMGSPTAQPPIAVNNPMGINPPAGVVEAGEHVFEKPLVDSVGSGTLDNLRSAIRTGRVTGGDINQLAGGAPSYCRGGKVKSYNRGGLVLPSYQDGGTVDWTKLSPTGGGKVADDFGVKPDERLSPYGGGQVAADFGARPENTMLPGSGALREYKLQQGSGLGADVSSQYMPTAASISKQRAGAGLSPDVSSRYGSGIAKTPPIPTAAPVTSIPPKVPQPPSGEELARIQGLKGIAQIASGQSPIFRTLANLAQQQIATQGAIDEASLRQQMAQMGVNGEAATAMMADLNRDIGSQQAQTAAATATAAQQLSAQAMGDLATQGLSGMRFDYQKQTDALAQALATKNYDVYGTLAHDLYGVTLDTTAMKNADSGAAFADSIQGLDTSLLASGAKYEDATVQQYVKAAWDASHPGQPYDEQWGRNLVSTRQAAASPSGKAANAITYQDLTDNYHMTPEQIDGMTYTTAAGNVVTGYAAFQTAMVEAAAPGGGLTFDENNNWHLNGSTNAVQFLQKYTGGATDTPAGTNVDEDNNDLGTFTPTNVVGVNATTDGKTYYKDAEGINQPVTFSGSPVLADTTSPSGFSANGVAISVDSDGNSSTFTYTNYVNKVGGMDKTDPVIMDKWFRNDSGYHMDLFTTATTNKTVTGYKGMLKTSPAYAYALSHSVDAATSLSDARVGGVIKYNGEIYSVKSVPSSSVQSPANALQQYFEIVDVNGVTHKIQAFNDVDRGWIFTKFWP